MDVAAGRLKLPRFSALVAIKTMPTVKVKPGKFVENLSVFSMQMVLDITRVFGIIVEKVWKVITVRLI